MIQSQKTPAELGTMIKRYENKFQMYITYCNNKPKSEHIVTEHAQYFDLVRQKLGHRLDVSIKQQQQRRLMPENIMRYINIVLCVFIIFNINLILFLFVKTVE